MSKMESSASTSRANESSNWRTRDGPALPATSKWSREKLRRNDGDVRKTSTNGSRFTAATSAKSVASPDEVQEEIDYSKRIYLGNLLYFATEDDVKILLDGHEYTKITISIDPFTSRNPSYCFVDFNTEDEAQRAMVELNGKLLLKRPIQARRARPPESEKYQQFRPRPPRESWKEVSQDRRQAWAFNRWEKDPSEAREHNTPPEGCRLWVGSLPSFNLNPIHVQTNLRAFFEDAGFVPTAISKIIPPAPEHKQADEFDHYCFVDFATKDEATAQMKLHNSVAHWGPKPVKIRASGKTAPSSWKINQRKDYMKQHGLASPVEQGDEPTLVQTMEGLRIPDVSHKIT